MKELLLSLPKHLRVMRYRWLVLLHDALVIPLAWLAAYWLRYNFGDVPDPFLQQAISLIPLVVLIQTGTLVFFGVHRGVWRFTSLPDLVRLIQAIVIGTTLMALPIVLITRMEFVPRSVFVLYALLLALILCGSRLAYRLVNDRHFSTKIEKKALVVGAGAAGEQLVRDLKRNSPRVYDPVAFVDDDPKKVDKEIHGVRVVASCDVIGEICERWNIDLIVIAIPSATDKQMQRIVEKCEKTGIEFRTLPTIHDVVSGHVNFHDMREVRIEDLLGRDPVRLDWAGIRDHIRNKKVLITGGGGSIGSELTRQIATLDPTQLILYDHSEFNLYTIEREIHENYPNLNIAFVLGDVCDARALERVFVEHKPDIVFHAAAYKHVPLLEGQIREAVKNNIIGTRAVADRAHKSGCDRFVLISTDKAVNPTSLMGACKRVAEIYCQALNSQSQTRFVMVRFGNVLGSTGSVVPLFRKQIREGVPVTVTHPDVTRYFMTITEATQLILQASSAGEGGEIFVLDMGKPIKIAFLAERMIKLSGKEPGRDIEIVYTGLRPGEKLVEELFYNEETAVKTEHDKILLARSGEVAWQVVVPIIERMEQQVQNFEEESLVGLLKHLVPEIDRDTGNFGIEKVGSG